MRHTKCSMRLRMHMCVRREKREGGVGDNGEWTAVSDFFSAYSLHIHMDCKNDDFGLPPKAGPKAKDQTNGSSGKSNVDLLTNDVTNFTIMTVTGTLSKMADAKADIHNIIKIDIAKRLRLSTHNIMDSVSSPIQLKRPNRSTHSIITNIAAKNNKVVHSILCIS
uniref:Uncharacterized protein n=1 Tax=Glossina austeni TaxID=7395 RepID=A0A1A9UPK1_GLOAU